MATTENVEAILLMIMHTATSNCMDELIENAKDDLKDGKLELDDLKKMLELFAHASATLTTEIVRMCREGQISGEGMLKPTNRQESQA